MIASLRRRRGPVIRFWDADFNLLHTEPGRVESWSAWFTRQASRLFRACT